MGRWALCPLQPPCPPVGVEKTLQRAPRFLFERGRGGKAHGDCLWGLRIFGSKAYWGLPGSGLGAEAQGD